MGETNFGREPFVVLPWEYEFDIIRTSSRLGSCSRAESSAGIKRHECVKKFLRLCILEIEEDKEISTSPSNVVRDDSTYMDVRFGNLQETSSGGIRRPLAAGNVNVEFLKAVVEETSGGLAPQIIGYEFSIDL